ncbi:hypothetical protein V8D89_002040 [Ganoderma adspersum]
MPPTTHFLSSPLDLNPVPWPCILLLLQTPLSHFQPCRAVLCQTELRPFSRWARDHAHPYHVGRTAMPLHSMTPSHHGTPGPSRLCAGTPGPSQPKSVHFPTEQLPASDDEGSRDKDDHEITGLRGPDADGFISKPLGGVGHNSVYKPLKKKVNIDISNYLDHMLSASNQPAGLLKNVTKVFCDGWPITDMIHLRLKYTSGHSQCGLPKTPQGEEYLKDISEALVVERHLELEVAREIVGGRRTSRAVRAQEEGRKNDGPSLEAGSKQALRHGEAREEEQNSDSEDNN